MDKQPYECLRPVSHDNRYHAVGETIELDHEQAAALLRLGAVQAIAAVAQSPAEADASGNPKKGKPP